MTERFPDGFVWGTATASYQIEGAAHEDGKGPSIWDTFSHTPGKVYRRHTGDVACDHYHRWPEDIKLMQELGVGAYRFSIAWPRILPQGTGTVNAKGLDFYSRLVDALLAAGITPFVTLYHWDLPQALEDKGGWAERGVVDAFVRYCDVVAGRLGDRVKHWITLNEPWVSAFIGYYEGRHAPGKTDFATALLAAHHLILSHMGALPVLRAASKGAQVGVTLNLSPVRPDRASLEDQAAAVRFDGYHNRWFLDPVFGRGYPADMLALYKHVFPEQHWGDVSRAPAMDFLGINNYAPAWVRNAPDSGWPVACASRSPAELKAAGFELTEMGWPVDATGMYDILTRVQKDYTPAAIYVTENGCAFPDRVVRSRVHDPRRINYLREHISAVRRALRDGAKMRGYFVWSLLDNFEWAYGYSKRFGLVHVNFATQKRTPKDSFYWYKKVVAANAVVE